MNRTGTRTLIIGGLALAMLAGAAPTAAQRSDERRAHSAAMAAQRLVGARGMLGRTSASLFATNLHLARLRAANSGLTSGVRLQEAMQLAQASRLLRSARLHRPMMNTDRLRYALHTAEARSRTGFSGAVRAPVPELPAPSGDDPDDDIYREARAALAQGEWRKAGDLFAALREEYPNSEYTPDSFYWQAYALYRTGGSSNLGVAVELLERQGSAYPEAASRPDARELMVQLEGQRARRGEAGAARRVAERASQEEACDEVRLAALNALMNMDPERAVPLLKRVLARPDTCAEIREQAVFLLAQSGADGVEDVMVDLIRNDPSPEVREQAVFWLSQFGSEEAVLALEEVLISSDDAELQEQAVFALSQHMSDEAAVIVRDYAMDSSHPVEVRANAIFAIGQHAGDGNSQFLMDIYPTLEDQELKEQVFFSLAQTAGEENVDWMLERAQDPNEDLEVRTQAIFWAVQSGAPIASLEGLYESTPDREMKEQLIFAYSQQSGSEALDRLIEIARTETDPELRSTAIFWLGQYATDDPRVAELILEIIDADPPR